MKTILFISVLFLTSTLAQQPQKYINVNGTSELVRSADQINFSIRIRTVDQSMEKSKSANDINSSALLILLNKHGIDEDNIEVSPLKLGKNFEYVEEERRQVHKGFFTEVDISFTLKDLTKYYVLSNDLAKRDAYEITSAVYSISDYEAQHKAAYEDALKAAKEKALYMCSTLGVKLGDVLEIDENSQLQGYPNPFNTVTIESTQGANPSGKVTIRRSVRVKFAIE